LEYLLVATAGFILIPFGIFKPTAFIAERVFGAILGLGIKLMVLAIVVGLSHSYLETISVPETSSWQDGIKFAVIGLCLAFLSVHAPSLAQSLLSGSPQLTAGSVMATAGGAASLAGGGISSFKTAASTTGNTAKAISAATGALSGGAAAGTAALRQNNSSPSLGSVVAAGSTGAVKGALGAAKDAIEERMTYGSVGSPEGGRAYREGMNDRTLGSSASYPGAKRNHGLLGSFNAGKFAVKGYRELHKSQEEAKQRKEDSTKAKPANQDDFKTNSNGKIEQPQRKV
jgi:type IV secretion system protein TrbL